MDKTTRSLKLFGLTIPLTLLATILALTLVGTSFAYFLVFNLSATTVDVDESIIVTMISDLPSNLYPGQGTCAKILIHNNAPSLDLGSYSLTVKMLVSGDVMLEGMSIVYTDVDGNYGSHSDLGSAEPLRYILVNTEAEQFTTFVFDLGIVDYVQADWYGMGEGETVDKGLSNTVKVFCGFRVSPDADPSVDVNMDIEVFRN